MSYFFLHVERLRTWFAKLLGTRPFARNVSLLAGGTVISQGLVVLLAPALTRLYSAEDFGFLQIYLSLMMFGAVAVTMRYEQAIFLPEGDEVAANVVAATLCVVVLVSILYGGLAWFLQGHGFIPVRIRGLRPYLWLVPLGTFGAGIYQTLSVWALRQRAYSRVSQTKIAQVASQLSTQVILGFLQIGPFGLLLGDAIGRFSGSLSLARLAWQRSKVVFCLVRWKTVRAAAVRYRNFPLVSNWAALVGVAATALPALLIAQLYGPKTLGWFALGDRVLGAPALLIGQAISQVYSVEAASLGGADPEAMRGLFRRSAKRLAILGIAPLLVFLLFSPLLFGFVFGASWREAGVYARLLSPMHYVAFVSWPLTTTLNLLERQVWQLAWDIGRLVLTLGPLWFIYSWGWSARVAVGAFGGGMILSYAVHLLLSNYAITKRIEQSRLSSGSRAVALQQSAETGIA